MPLKRRLGYCKFSSNTFLSQSVIVYSGLIARKRHWIGKLHVFFFYKKLRLACSTKGFLISHENFSFLVLKGFGFASYFMDGGGFYHCQVFVSWHAAQYSSRTQILWAQSIELLWILPKNIGSKAISHNLLSFCF